MNPHGTCPTDFESAMSANSITLPLNLVGTNGIEPSTSGLGDRCSVLLSYVPIIYGGDTWTRTRVPLMGADLQSAAVAAVPYPRIIW